MKGDFVQAFVERQRTRLRDPLISSSSEAQALAAQLDQLEQEYQLFQDAVLTPRAAAAESGFTEHHIRLLRKQQVIGDRRRDLPRKPGFGVERPKPRAVADPVPSIVDRVLRRRA